MLEENYHDIVITKKMLAERDHRAKLLIKYNNIPASYRFTRDATGSIVSDDAVQVEFINNSQELAKAAEVNPAMSIILANKKTYDN